MSYNRFGTGKIPEIYCYWNAGIEKPTLTIHISQDTLNYDVEQVKDLRDCLNSFLRDIETDAEI